LDGLLLAYALALGAIVGSFLNVVIHRYPREESIAFPPSHCPNCMAKIRPWHNIPVISYLILRGRCRDCRMPISFRYPLVELANALFYGATYLFVGPTIAFLLVAAIVSMTIVLIYIDLDIQILPDVVDKPGIVVGLFIGAMELGDRFPTMILSPTLLDSVIGAAAGWLLLFSVAWLYKAWRDIEGMGQGDMKMLAMIGAVSGWQVILPVLFLASFAGAIFGVGLAMRRGSGLQYALPFGVFLGIAQLVVLFFGTTLLSWYQSLLPA
jgi:leader peptidase (prepilin peptidase)/N-methyltransferase